MTELNVDIVIPEKFPELARLAWNRDAAQPMTGEDAFALYERNWRHVDTAHLTADELALIEQLKITYGNGHMLV